MSIYELSELDTINFAPANEIEEICQNVRMIIKTVKGTYPMSRNFGIEDYLDGASNIVEAGLSASIAEEISKYEPRCTLKAINYDYSSEIRIRVVIEIGRA